MQKFNIEYDSNTKQIKYLFENGQEGLEKQTVLDYFSGDYKTAISYYQEAQRTCQVPQQWQIKLHLLLFLQDLLLKNMEYYLRKV